MRTRGTTIVYNATAAAWLVAAGLSLLLPDPWRLGLWLPLHLTLAGAISVAISGNMLGFSTTLTATPEPPRRWIAVQYALVVAGAALVATGRPLDLPGLVGLGGAIFVTGALLLGGLVLTAWRRGINRRHGIVIALYGAAVASLVTGATIGAVLGAGVIGDPIVWAGLRRGHVAFNVLGWASLTIAGTMTTLLPTTLRVRMPRWHAGSTSGLLVGGLLALGVGLAARWDAIAALGAAGYAAAATGVAWMAVRAARTTRRRSAPISAKHLLAGLAWFVAGTIGLTVALIAGGAEGFDAYRPLFLTSLVGGWTVQVLLGAWLYLIPASSPGHPDDRRRSFAAVDVAGTPQVVGGNLGLVLVALGSVDLLPAAVGVTGAGLALAAAAVAVGKAWGHRALARLPFAARRSAELWET